MPKNVIIRSLSLCLCVQLYCVKLLLLPQQQVTEENEGRKTKREGGGVPLVIAYVIWKYPCIFPRCHGTETLMKS